MSGAKWCDHGNHAYSDRDSEAQTFTISKQATDGYGRQTAVSLSKDICGPCANGVGLWESTDQNARKALEAQRKGYDPEYVKWLEDQADKNVEAKTE